MDREWTYRPPVLVGERVVWLGDAAPRDGQPSSSKCQPHHGTVSWIGRVPEMGSDWTVGVEFDLDMPSGCDGSWKGRRLFSCPKMRGLFLPVASVLREKEFYDKKGSSSKPSTSIDLSLAPEPPPPKNKTSRSSFLSMSHLKGARKQSEDGGTKTPNHPTHKGTGASCVSSPSSGAAVVTSPQCSSSTDSSFTSKKQILAGRHINTEPQDTPQDKSFSRTETLRTTSSGPATEAGATGPAESESDHSKAFCSDSMYFGETMVRKSTLTTTTSYTEYSERVRLSHQPSISTPSSPSLSEYQRHCGKKLSCSSTSTTASDLSKCMSTPGRYSASQSPFAERKERSGFFGIFRWFRNRDKKKRSASVDGMSNTSSGSINSLASSYSSSAYSPIIRSKSADIQNRIDTRNQGQFGMTRRYKLFSKNSSPSEGSGRRLSAISACSETSSRAGSRGATLTRKKRPAPQPPSSSKQSDTESLKSQKSCASLPARELRPTKSPDSTSATSPDQASTYRRLHKSKSEGVIYTKVKRRAPLPPVQGNTGGTSEKEPNKASSAGAKSKSPTAAVCSKSSGVRPVSTVSNVSSLSQSLSSASTTLKSQSSSITSSGPSSSQYSADSMVLESGYLRQDISKSSSSPAIADTGKVTLSPRPWYKRKNKSKESKNVSDAEKGEKVYDSWMPEIQFARRKLNLGSSLRRGKSQDAPQGSKEDKKEKRKSQVSLLANISELDRAASEQMQREQVNKQVQKQTDDSKFYRTSEPHFLTQTDFLPQTQDRYAGEASDLGTMSSSECATLKSSTSVKTGRGEHLVHCESGIYDNFSLSDQDLTLPQSYSKQATLRVEEKEKIQHSASDQVQASYELNSSVRALNSVGMSSPTTSVSRSSTEASRHQNPPAAAEPPSPVTRDSPLHRATIDAELFYQLAKDTHNSSEPKVKSSPVLSGIRESRRFISGQASGGETEDENIHMAESPNSPRRPNKNFGFRMNNFFSPDVSTIIEASESMTSSATTPADDIYDDLPASSVNGKGRRESIQDEAASEINYEFQLNSSDAREIMRELADVRQEIEKINEEEEMESRERERTKAQKIREEVLLLREANNFEAWHNAVEQRGAAGATDTAPPTPVNLNEGPNRKLKWVCEVCTLNNLPWRLQCEACMARRPANPKRVDDDGKSVGSDFVSPQESVSNESPITVIFEDGNGNRECPREGLEGAGAVVAGNEESAAGNEQNIPNEKKKKDINWERELQKYFRTFDEHVNPGGSDSHGEKGSANKPLRTDASSSRASEKVTKKSERETGARGHKPVESSSDSRGAKPKIKFFGTASGPPSTFIPGPNTLEVREGSRQGNTSSVVEESHLDETKILPDVEAVRRARLAKFQGSVNENEQGDESGAHESYNMEKKTEIENERRRKNSRTEIPETNRNGPDIQEGYTQRRDTQRPSDSDYAPQENSSIKHHKPQVIKPSGAVRTVVSIFNQFEQLRQANRDKPPLTRRKSSTGSLMERTQAFEQVIPEPSSPELQVVRRRERPKKVKDSSPRDKEVFSAIAKFDEMAAMAELENIDKFRHKSRGTRKPRVIKTSNEFPFQTNDTSVMSNSMVNRSPKSMRQTASSQSSSNCEGNNLPRDITHDLTSTSHTEGVIKDGVLYTEQRKRSTSISSGTFELIHAKDFVNIEAQHSESSSYSETRDTNDISSTLSYETLELPSITVEQMNGDGCPVQTSDNPPLVAHKAGAEPDGRPHLERKDVERLSRQLTEADGIATFKANLRVEESALGQTNTLNINRLLKRLEGAIARGNHAEAAKLAHELADFRVSCSVTRNDKNTTNNTSAVSPTNQGRSATKGKEANQPAPTLSEGESSGMQIPSSNTSECYYDAAEVMDDELSISEHDQLLDMGCINSLEELIQTKTISDSQVTPVMSSTKPSVPVTNSVHPHPGETSKRELSRGAVNGIEPQQSGKHSEASSSTQETPKVSGSPSATRRDVRIDPARREVKSDTISKLPDELQTHMKEEKQANQPFNVKMYVEDKNSHQGPLSFTVTPTMTVGQLREKVRQDFGFPTEVQRWILGKRLADDDHLTLEHHRVTSEGCPIFLYLVAPDLEPQTKPSSKDKTHWRSRYGENSHDDPQAAGTSGLPRYLEVYDEEGNVEYRYYNPETRRYEVSEDLDDGDLGDEEEEDDEEDDDDEDEEYEDGDDDTLEEDEGDEEMMGSGNIYPNVNQNDEEKLRNTKGELIQVDSGKSSSMQPSGHQRNDSLDAKYSLPPPIIAHHTTNNKNELMNQRNILNGHSSARNDQEGIRNNSNQQENLNSRDRLPAGYQMKQQEKLKSKKQQQQSSQPIQPPAVIEHSNNTSAVNPDFYVNNNQNNSPMTRASQEEYKVKLQNQKNQQQMQVSSKSNNIQYSQTPRIGSALDTTPPQQQKPKHDNINSLSGPGERQKPSAAGKQRQHPDLQTSNKSLASPQPSRPREKLPSPSRVHGWVCPTCTLVNAWARPGCEACATERPGTTHQQVTGADGKDSDLGAVVSVLDRQGCVPNPDPFECRVCFLDVDSGQGVVLRDCLHTFCRECLANAIRYSDTADVKCPYRDNQYSCDSSLQDREIKALVTEKEYEQHLNKSVKQAEGAMQNVFHCKTPDCPGFCQFEDNVNEFHCDVCGKVNCLTCQAQHEDFKTCQEYQDDLANKVDEAAMKTKKFFDDMIRRGDGLPCPKCSVMLVRKWGCDWMRCPMCRTEICWVTRGPRWGPGGPGDVSGGCKCGIRGQKCHPKCTYCH